MPRNGKATLVKQNGDRLQAASQDAVNTVSALNQTTGEILRDALLDAINYTPSANSGAGDDDGVNYSKAKLRSIGQAFKDSKELIKTLEAKAKAWASAGALKIDEFISEFTAWAIGLAPVDGEDGKPLMLEGITPEGVKVAMPAREAITGSIRFLLYAMLDLSNSQFFGQTSRIGKDGKRKPPKPSVFENERKNAQTAQATAGNENWRMRFSVNYLLNEGIAGQKVCKAIELHASAASFLNQRDLPECEKQFRILTGQMKGDTRFNFNPSLSKAFIIVRGYGLLISGARQWIKELKEADSDATKQASWLVTESVELASMMADIERNKAFKENHQDESNVETIAESNVPSPNGSASDASKPEVTLARFEREYVELNRQIDSDAPEFAEVTVESSSKKLGYLEQQIEALGGNLDSLLGTAEAATN